MNNRENVNSKNTNTDKNTEETPPEQDQKVDEGQRILDKYKQFMPQEIMANNEQLPPKGIMLEMTVYNPVDQGKRGCVVTVTRYSKLNPVDTDIKDSPKTRTFVSTVCDHFHMSVEPIATFNPDQSVSNKIAYYLPVAQSEMMPIQLSNDSNKAVLMQRELHHSDRNVDFTLINEAPTDGTRFTAGLVFEDNQIPDLVKVLNSTLIDQGIVTPDDATIIVQNFIEKFVQKLES